MGRGGGWFRNHRSHGFSKLVPGLLSLLDRIWVDVGESASRGVSDLVNLELTLRRWTRCASAWRRRLMLWLRWVVTSPIGPSELVSRLQSAHSSSTIQIATVIFVFGWIAGLACG